MEYVQTRMRHKIDNGWRYTCMWIPSVGTNGVKVSVGSGVHLKGDPNQMWEVLSTGGIPMSSDYFARKRSEVAQRAATI